MAIVKGTQSAALLKDAIVLDLSDLRRQAARLQAAAEAKAARIVADAEAQASAVETQAHDEAYSRGYKLGQEEGHAAGLEQGTEQARAAAAETLQNVEKKWSESLAEFESHLQKTIDEAKHATLAMALTFCEKLVHRVIEVDPSVIVDQVASSLAYVLRPYDVSLQINPADREILEGAMPKLIQELRQLEHVALVDSKDIGVGGCVVSSGEGQIDARIETQLARVIEMILPDEKYLHESTDTHKPQTPATDTAPDTASEVPPDDPAASASPPPNSPPSPPNSPPTPPHTTPSPPTTSPPSQ